MNNPEVGNNPELKPSVEQLIVWGERALSGELLGDISEFEEANATGETVEGEFDLGDGPILDLNDTRYDDKEKAQLSTWLEGKLGASLENAERSGLYEYVDGSVTFSRFAKQFGTETNPWFVTEWRSVAIEDAEVSQEVSQPWYVLWSESMIDAQEESGMYTKQEDL